MRASADLRIRSNRTNPVPQHGVKSTTGRIYKDLGEKKIQYLIALALNVITLSLCELDLCPPVGWELGADRECTR